MSQTFLTGAQPPHRQQRAGWPVCAEPTDTLCVPVTDGWEMRANMTCDVMEAGRMGSTRTPSPLRQKLQKC